MAIPEHNISGKPWKWWSSYLRPLVHHKWGKRCLSEREKFTVLLEAAAALIYTAASCSAAPPALAFGAPTADKEVHQAVHGMI